MNPPPRPQMIQINFHSEITPVEHDRWRRRNPLEAAYDSHEVVAGDDVGQRDAAPPHPEQNAFAQFVLAEG